jgi:hypothetical protein
VCWLFVCSFIRARMCLVRVMINLSQSGEQRGKVAASFFVTFFPEKKVECFLSLKLWRAARVQRFSFEEYSAALSCTVRVTLFGGGRLVLLRICFCVCVRFLFGEGEGASFFSPLYREELACVCYHTQTQTRAHLSLESLFQHILILLLPWW